MNKSFGVYFIVYPFYLHLKWLIFVSKLPAHGNGEANFGKAKRIRT